jgi:hypothetical protein
MNAVPPVCRQRCLQFIENRLPQLAKTNCVKIYALTNLLYIGIRIDLPNAASVRQLLVPAGLDIL